ncbi:hypothetical protein GCM10011575_44990 [Microlunatus endophyticus]|uniref:Uncharacterized protein n=1 Tax=Microlunatus endophyticus TaxID=1716077 RepID=A0A917W9L7_9ACTN|nr:hypothetical protein GCM10011575_44990 [Microlunatus endophyticus]
MAAGSRAWVFGGMGSWNDLGFPDEGVEQDYEQLSSTLFAAVLTAITTATNSAAP